MAEISKDWSERFVEVMNGLGIDKPISTKLFNFMYYEIAMVRKQTKLQEKENIMEGVNKLPLCWALYEEKIAKSEIINLLK